MKLLIASNNSHKIAEISAALNGKFDEIRTLEQENIVCDPEETGKTFAENALIKANAIGDLSGCAVLADDTGLCVNALDGRPGVLSARYASDHDSSANRKKLLCELRDVVDRTAYFECAVALKFPDGKILTGNGRIYGTILTHEQGENGFGYDSIFYCTELHKTFAEATMQEKLSVSHRGRALADLLSKL